MHTIFFDIDGTLVNTGSAGSSAMVAALSEAFGVAGNAEGIGFAGRSDHWLISQLLQKHGIPDEETNRQTYVRQFLVTLQQMLPQRQGTVLPGVLPVLETLAARSDVHLALLTGNLRQAARLKLDHYGLSCFFHMAKPHHGATPSTNEHYATGGFGDLHPLRDDIAKSAVDDVERSRNGQCIARDKMWVIGDTPHDVQCARAIGAKAIAVATGSSSPDELARHNPDLVVANLTEGERWLKMIV